MLEYFVEIKIWTLQGSMVSLDYQDFV